MAIKSILYLFSFLLLFSTFQCKETENKKQDQAKAEVKPNNLPKLPEQEYSRLYEECDFIDYIFFDLPFSLSQNEKPSIQQNVLFISKDEVNGIPTGCKAMARKFFKIKGNIVLEADVFMDGKCNYFLFYKDGKATYLNKMNQAGINFYNNLIDQAAKMNPGNSQ
jgi:hypothetical protein